MTACPNRHRGPQLPSFHPYSSAPFASRGLVLLAFTRSPHSPTPSRHHAPPVEAPGPRGRDGGAPRRRGPLPPRGRGPPAATLRPPRGRFRGQFPGPPASCTSVPSPHCALSIPRRSRMSIRVAGADRRAQRSGWTAGVFNGVAWSRARAVWR